MANRRILIVDDEIIIARDLEARLAGFGYEVVGIASSGREAIALAEQTAPNLILMDIALKGDMDGIEAAAEIHHRWAIPLIFLTAYTDEATLQRAKVTEPFGYIVKPFTERELRANIEMALYKDEAIKQTHELEERFFAVSIDMLCFLDFSGYFRRLNHAWEKTLGFSREELFSKPFIEFVHPDDRERTLNQNRQVRAGAQALLFENRYLCKDGSYKWLLWNSVPDPEHQIIYAVARDITERKQAEDALRASELRFRSLTQSANDAIISADTETRIISWNKGAEATFGYTEAEALGEPLHILMPERYKEAHRKGVERFVTTGESHVIGKTVELHGRRKDGSEFPLELSLSSWQTREGVFFSAIIRDITERRQAQERREQLVRELQAALAEVKSLQAILPICSYCKKIRNDQDYWQSVEGYISEHTDARFSHSICPSCYQREIEPMLEEFEKR